MEVTVGGVGGDTPPPAGGKMVLSFLSAPGELFK
jgi:hypothetical protein